ncbi:GerAB/ArcD/ProY family transporter, partial [Paenibacillus sp. TAF58]
MKLSSYQLFWLLFSMELGMTNLFTLSPAFAEAKQGILLAMVISLFASIVITYIAAKTSLFFPNETFVEFVQKLIGRWLGRAIVLVYLFIWIVIAGIILREYADFVYLVLFSNTPLWVIILFMLIVMVYAVHSGLHIVARCSEIIGPFVLLSVVLFSLLALKDVKPLRLFPLLPSEGWPP